MRSVFIFFACLIPAVPYLRAQDQTLLRTTLTDGLAETRRPAYTYPEVLDIARNNIDSGISALWNIIRDGSQSGNINLLFQGYFGLGAAYSTKGEYDKARGYFHRALIYSVKTLDPTTNTCRVLNNIGNACLWQGNYREAAAYCFKAAMLAERGADRDTMLADQLIRIYNNIATSLLYMHEYRKALYYVRKAETLALRLRHYIRLPSILNNKAMICYSTNAPEQAWAYYNKALTLAKAHHHFQEEYVALYGLATYMTDHHQSRQAISYLEAATRIRGALNPSYKARTFSALGNIYLMQQDYARAEYYLLLALEKGQLARALDCILQAHRQLAVLGAQTRNYARAFEHMQAAYLLNDSLLNSEKTEAVSRLEVKYRTVQKDKELAQKQLFINDQKRKLYQQNTWIWISSLGILLLTSTSLFLFVLYRNNRHKQSLQEERIRGMEQEQEIQHLKAIMEGEEQERARIARELHDGIGGMLAAIKMNFSSLQQQCAPVLAGTGNGGNLERFAKIFDMLNETGSEIRETAHNLMPDILARHGLTEALQLYCDKINAGNRLYLKLRLQGQPGQLPEPLRLPVYRIVQELVQNILKHAEATNALIRLMQDADRLRILIRDNGKGFDAAAPVVSGMGLENIRSRVQTLRGEMTVESTPETGTTVQITIDLRNFKDPPSHEHSDSHSG